MSTSRPNRPSSEAVAHAATQRGLTAALGVPAKATPEVLHELIGRRAPQLRQTLEGIVGDPSQPTALRTVATLGLGGLQDVRSIATLLVAAQGTDASISRRAFEALGRVGTPETLKALSQMSVAPGRARKSLNFARSLIAYRHGLEGQRMTLPRGSSVTAVDTTRARALPAARLSPRAWAALRPSLMGADSSMVPTTQAPLEILCGRDRLLLMLNPAVDGTPPTTAFARPVVAGVVMKFSPALARWHVAEYVLSHPGRSGQAQLLGVRPSGAIVHSGTVLFDAGQARIDLQALDSPLVAPSRIEATLGATQLRGLDFKALVEPDRTRQQNRPRPPKPVVA